MRRKPTFGDLGETISGVAALDVAVRPGARATARALTGRLRSTLQGVPIGEPLHPVLTDVVIGAWTSSWFLDLLGGRASRRAARLLVGLGVLAAVPTVASGAADWIDLGPDEQRVGLVHATVNTTATLLYGCSWLARRRGDHGRGARLGLAGAAVATVGAGLGGYLVYRRGTGVNRSIIDEIAGEWTDVGEVRVDGSPVAVESGRGRLVVCRTAAGISALADTCSHQGGPLHEGAVGEGCIRCPWHGSEFRLRDGSVARGPATSPQPCFDVRPEGARLQVRRAR